MEIGAKKESELPKTREYISESILSFFVPGKPQGKARARAYVPVKKSKNLVRPEDIKIHHYTPTQTGTYESLVAWSARVAMASREPFLFPVFMVITILTPVPDSWPHWKRRAAEFGHIWPTVKPDDDNVEKAIKDACNTIVYPDDCYSVVTNKLKRYCRAREEQGVQVEIKKIIGVSAQVKTKAEFERYLSETRAIKG